MMLQRFKIKPRSAYHGKAYEEGGAPHCLHSLSLLIQFPGRAICSFPGIRSGYPVFQATAGAST